MQYETIEQQIGNTPLVRLQRLDKYLKQNNNTILCKLEGENPAGSVKDRPAFNMIDQGEKQGIIKPGDTLIEPTSGNTGIALAMVCAIKGYKLKILLPKNSSLERKAAIAAYGAELILTDGMENARDLAEDMQKRGEGTIVGQFSNLLNPQAHITNTGPEIWQQTSGQITHFVSSMGTTGTIMGNSDYLKSKNKDIQIIGLQPKEGANIPGIRRWPKEYLPKFYERNKIDRIIDISQQEAEETMRAMARSEGILAGVSSGGAVSGALRIAYEVRDSLIVCIICDRGDRYLSSNVYPPQTGMDDPQPCGVDSYPSSLACLISHPSPHYLYFSADRSASNNRPWCPDCDRSIDIAHEEIKKQKGTILEVQVGSRPQWKDPSHPFRSDPLLQLRSIPTLIKLQDGKVQVKVDKELEAAQSQQDIKQVIQTVLSS